MALLLGRFFYLHALRCGQESRGLFGTWDGKGQNVLRPGTPVACLLPFSFACFLLGQDFVRCDIPLCFSAVHVITRQGQRGTKVTIGGGSVIHALIGFAVAAAAAADSIKKKSEESNSAPVSLASKRQLAACNKHISRKARPSSADCHVKLYLYLHAPPPSLPRPPRRLHDWP